jgi:hypothetical protein
MNSKLNVGKQKTRKVVPPEKNRDKNARTLDYRKYSTNPIEFQTWLDVIYSKIHLPIPVASALIGATVFLSGFVIASTFDFSAEYFRTKAIYIGVFGIALVSGMVRYASLNIHRVFETLRPCFLIEDKPYKALISRWFSKLSKNTGNAVAIAIYGLLAILAAFAEFFSPLENRQSALSLKAYFFEPFWYTPENLGCKTIIIAFYGICVAFPLGIATSLLINNRSFMKDLINLPVVPMPQIVRVRLREVLDFYLRILFAWSIGVGLFGLVFFNALDALSILFLSILNVFALTTFVLPQLCYRRYLRQAEMWATRQALKRYYSRSKIKLDERPGNSIMDDAFFQADNPAQGAYARPTIYEWTDFIVLIVSQLIVYGSALLGRFM